MGSSGRKSKTKYLTFENRNLGSSSSVYRQINIYTVESDTKMCEKRNIFRECIDWCLCKSCKSVSEDLHEAPIDNHNSLLESPIGNSYTLNREVIVPEQKMPTVTITRVIDEFPSLDDIKDIENEYSKSTTKLLLSSEQVATSISLNNKYKVKKKTGSFDVTPERSETNSGSNTLRSGEKVSFIREVLSCRDSFLNSLEWCDNSLTRGKRYRNIKRDEWLELQNEGINTVV